MIAFKHPVTDDPVPAEGHFDPIGGSVGKIIPVQEVVVASALPRIHGRLPGPEKKPISSVRYIIFIKNIVAALFVHQHARAVLAPVIHTVAISPYIKDDPVIQDLVPAAAVHPDADTGVEGKIIVQDHAVIASRHHERILTACDPAVTDSGKIAVAQVNRRPVTHPLVLLIVMVTHPVGNILPLLAAVEMLAVIITEVAVLQGQLLRITCQ